GHPVDSGGPIFNYLCHVEAQNRSPFRITSSSNGDDLQDVIRVDIEVSQNREFRSSLVPHLSKPNIVGESTSREQFEDGEFDSRSVKRFEDRADRLGIG